VGEKISKANSKKGKRYVEKISNVVWTIVKLTCPKFFKRPKSVSQSKTLEEEEN
jgi:hypothetical protein